MQRTAGFLALIICAASVGAAGKDKEALTRSFYVPLRVNLCEHVEGAILYRGDTPLTELPGSHVFQFTFFPELKRIVPEIDRVRVEGKDDQGEPFRTEIVVTPASVYVGDKKIDLDLERAMRELHRRIDFRHEVVTITLRCAHACPRSSR